MCVSSDIPSYQLQSRSDVDQAIHPCICSGVSALWGADVSGRDARANEGRGRTAALAWCAYTHNWWSKCGSRQPITFDVAGNVIDEWSVFDANTKRFRPTRVRLSLAGVGLQTDTLPIPIGADAGEYKIVTAEKSASGTVIGTSEQRIYQPYGPQWVRAYGARGAHSAGDTALRERTRDR